MTAVDPTKLACTPQLALTLAEALLGSAPASEGDSCRLWASYATLPLAGLLFAAHRDNRGVDWALEAATNTGRHRSSNDPGWVSAAQRIADAPILASAMLRTATMTARQRDILAKAVTGALAIYAPRTAGERW